METSTKEIGKII